VDQGGDTQAGGVEDDPLLPHELGRAVDGGHRGTAEDPGEVAEPVPAGRFERQRPPGREHVLHRRHGVVGVGVRGGLLAGFGLGIRQRTADPPAAELGDLLLERHLLKQQLDAVGRRQRRVLPPGRHPAPGSSGVRCRHRDLLREDRWIVSKLFDGVRKTGSVHLSKHLDMPHRPFYLDLRGHGRKCRNPGTT
jgi:hypothetical protein